jgi:hypothetical protein
VLALLTEQTGVAIVPFNSSSDSSVRLRLGRTSWRNVLTAISDLHGYCFVLRDYGLLVTFREQAVSLPGAAIPSDLPYWEGGGGSGFGGGGNGGGY